MGWQAWAVLSAVFTAATTLLARAGIAGVDSDVGVFFRSVVIVMTLACLFAMTGSVSDFRLLGRRSLILLSLSGLATAASWACLFRALATGPAGASAVLNKLSVVLVSVFGVLVLGESLNLTNWIGLLLVVTGTFLVTVR